MTPKAWAMAFAFCAVTLAAGQPTWPELVKQHAPPTFEEILIKADLIVQRRVAVSKTYLSDDKLHVYTDYVVTLTRLVFQRAGAVVPRPGTSTQILMRQFGGTMVLEGVEISEQDDNMLPLPTGRDLLLVLQYNKAEGKYELPGDVAGAFSVDAGRIAPLIRAAPAYERSRGMTTAQFDSEVQACETKSVAIATM